MRRVRRLTRDFSHLGTQQTVAALYFYSIYLTDFKEAFSSVSCENYISVCVDGVSTGVCMCLTWDGGGPAQWVGGVYRSRFRRGCGQSTPRGGAPGDIIRLNTNTEVRVQQLVQTEIKDSFPTGTDLQTPRTCWDQFLKHMLRMIWWSLKFVMDNLILIKSVSKNWTQRAPDQSSPPDTPG